MERWEIAIIGAGPAGLMAAQAAAKAQRAQGRPVSVVVLEGNPKPGKLAVWLLLIFMAVNMSVSSLALARYSDRAAGQPADAAWEMWMDAHYGDQVMERIYPYAKMTD